MGDNTEIISIAPRPWVCIPGDDRPYGVPYYNGPAACGANEAREAMREANVRLSEMCNDFAPEGKDLQWKGSTMFESPPVACSKFYSKIKTKFFGEIYAPTSIPVVLDNFGLMDVVHPFFDIVYRLNIDQLQDFRSAGAFIKVTDAIEEEGLIAAEKRDFSVMYPGSGSHIAPLVMALLMIDNGSIDRAYFTFTEIDDEAARRIDTYLSAMSGGDDPIFTDYSTYNAETVNGERTFFVFDYKGKRISLSLLLDNAGRCYLPREFECSSYCPSEEMVEKDVLVIHDVGSVRETKLLVREAYLMQRIYGRNKTSWIVIGGEDIDHFTMTPDYSDVGAAIIGDLAFGGLQFFDAPYGCGLQARRTELNPPVWMATQDGVVAGKRGYDDPFCGAYAVHIDSALAMDRGTYLLNLDSAKVRP